MSSSDVELPRHQWMTEMAKYDPELEHAFVSWLSAVEAMPGPDVMTAKLIRLALSVVVPSQAGVRRNTILAAEVGARWEDIFGTLLLTLPSGGTGALDWAYEIAKTAYDEVMEAREFPTTDQGLC